MTDLSSQQPGRIIGCTDGCNNAACCSDSEGDDGERARLFDIAKMVLFCPREERVARELRDLPKEEREQVWADMMGDPEITPYEVNPEEPAFVNQKLLEMDQELANSSSRGFAFDHVRRTAPSYLRKLRLLFLRSTEFNVKEAVKRMQVHFDEKLELFGIDKLTRDIQFSDLSDLDIKALQAGGYQFLPKKDAAGRLVMVGRYGELCKEKDNMLRAFFYLLTAALRDEDVQRRGIVAVGYEINWVNAANITVLSVDFELLRRLSNMICMVVPIRVVASYQCVNDAIWARASDVMIHFVSSFVRVRNRILYGSEQECRYKLMSVGIPEQALPFSASGYLQRDYHLAWLRHQQSIETGYASPNTLAMMYPAQPVLIEDDEDSDPMET